MTHSSQKKLGKGMITISWVIVLIVLMMFFRGLAQEKNNPNQQITSETAEGVRTITLEKNNYGHYVLTAMVNNVAVTFLLDTGATDVVLPEAIAKKAKLIAGRRSEANTANGTIWVRNTKISELRLGDIVLNDVNASINPHMEGKALLGMSALGNLEWTQRGDQLTIRQYY